MNSQNKMVSTQTSKNSLQEFILTSKDGKTFIHCEDYERNFCQKKANCRNKQSCANGHHTELCSEDRYCDCNEKNCKKLHKMLHESVNIQDFCIYGTQCLFEECEKEHKKVCFRGSRRCFDFNCEFLHFFESEYVPYCSNDYEGGRCETPRSHCIFRHQNPTTNEHCHFGMICPIPGCEKDHKIELYRDDLRTTENSLHPFCKYGISCNNPSCTFFHVEGIPSSVSDQEEIYNYEEEEQDEQNEQDEQDEQDEKELEEVLEELEKIQKQEIQEEFKKIKNEDNEADEAYEAYENELDIQEYQEEFEKFNNENEAHEANRKEVEKYKEEYKHKDEAEAKKKKKDEAEAERETNETAEIDEPETLDSINKKISDLEAKKLSIETEKAKNGFKFSGTAYDQPSFVYGVSMDGDEEKKRAMATIRYIIDFTDKFPTQQAEKSRHWISYKDAKQRELFLTFEDDELEDYKFAVRSLCGILRKQAFRLD